MVVFFLFSALVYTFPALVWSLWLCCVPGVRNFLVCNMSSCFITVCTGRLATRSVGATVDRGWICEKGMSALRIYMQTHVMVCGDLNTGAWCQRKHTVGPEPWCRLTGVKRFSGASRPQGHLPRLGSEGFRHVWSTIRDPRIIIIRAIPSYEGAAPYTRGIDGRNNDDIG